MEPKSSPPHGYSDTYYSRTLVDQTIYPKLQERITADVCIIGGGLAGLATGLGLAERGKRVAVLESRRIGWGASGRNGGFVLSGYSAHGAQLVKVAGRERARQLFDLSLKAQSLVRARIDQYDIPAHPVAGHLVASWYNAPDKVRAEADFLRDVFGENVEFWPREKVSAVCRTDKYYDGLFYPDAFHMHPLNYVKGVGQAIAALGGALYEESAAVRVLEKPGEIIVYTEDGSVQAGEIVYCGSAYFNALEKRLSRACLSIRSDVMVTEPIDHDLLHSAVTEPYAVRDDRWADNYYRILPDNRILWGGGCALGKAPNDLKERMLADMLKIYPQLRGVKADLAWSGLMGFTTSKMPYFAKLRDGVWACTNIGGQGLNVTTVGGELIAAAIASGDETYRLFDGLHGRYAGGILGPLVAQAVYYSWELGDWLGELFKNR